MPSKALYSKSARLKTPRVASLLPARIADLDGYALSAQCAGCGRHFQLYPGHADFHARLKLVSLLDRLACTGRHKGRTCGGVPRRLVLERDDRLWVLDGSGDWLEDDGAFWEASDFEALAVPRGSQAAF